MLHIYIYIYIKDKDIHKRDLQRYYIEDLFIHIPACYYINIYMLIKKSVYTILFFTHIYGNHKAWSFEVTEPKDEW